MHSSFGSITMPPDMLCWVLLQEEYVEDLIKRLGLAKSAETIVGDAKTRGISGEIPPLDGSHAFPQRHMAVS